MKKFWSILKWFILAFGVYLVIKSPTTAADAIKTAWLVGVEVSRGVLAFFDALTPSRR